MFEITPIAMTGVDWPRYVVGTNNAIKRSPTRQLDKMEQKVGSIESFVSTLGEFQNQGANTERTLQNPHYLKHVSFSFLVGMQKDTLLTLLTQSHNFAIITTTPGRMKENFIITASLDIWRQAVIDGCQNDIDVELREFYNEIWSFFVKAGFRDTFSNFRRHDLNDKTFVLEHKR